jgi:hypothetical protein
MRGLRVRLAGGGGVGRPKTGRMVKHKQHQANRLRKLAERHERQAIKSLKRRKDLLALAAKLEEQCYEPVIQEVMKEQKFGFARDE